MSTIGILGAGNIGKHTGIAFARAGHTILISNSRGGDSLAEVVEAIGPSAKAASVTDCVAHAGLVLLAVPWRLREQALPPGDAFAGKIVIDAMNPYTADGGIEDLGSLTSSEMVAVLMPKARLVKAFNTIYFIKILSPPLGPRLALPICGDDAEAKGVVAGLIQAIGYDAVDIGRLSNGRLQEPGTALYNRDLTAQEIRGELARLTA